MHIVNNNIAHIIIKATIGSVTVGMYQIAMKAQEIMLNLNEFYQKNILPSTSYLHQQNKIKELKDVDSKLKQKSILQRLLVFFAFYLLCEPLCIFG